MKRRWIALGGIWLAGAVLIGSMDLAERGTFDGEQNIYSYNRFPEKVYAAKSADSSDIQDEINDANARKSSLEQEKAELQNDLKEIEQKKDDILEYIEALDGKLKKLSDKIDQNQKDIDDTQEEIDRLIEQEEQAALKMNSQYDTMKKRIRYMYENGNDGYLEVLFQAASLSELFNRAEYVSKVSEYDQKMFGEYQKTRDQLAQTQKEKKEKMAVLVSKKESLDYEKESLNSLVKKKTGQLDAYEKQISNSEESLAAYRKRIASEEDAVERLLEKQRKQIAAEEAARKAREKAKNNGGNTSSDSGTDTEGGSTGQASASGFRWPLSASGRISSYFGYRDAPTEGASSFHKGIDVAVPTGTAVLASKAGEVVTAAYSSSAGNYVAIYHGDGVYTYYMHCSSLKVSVGDQVSGGQRIALSGSTGISTGPHLHFAININGSYVNPLNYVSR